MDAQGNIIPADEEESTVVFGFGSRDIEKKFENKIGLPEI